MIQERVKQLVSESKKNLSTLSKEIGMSRPLLYSLMDGSRNPSLDSVQKLADYFHVSVDYLLGKEAEADAVPQTPLSEQETKLLDAFRKLPPSTQIIVINFIADLANQGERKN